MVSFFLNLHTRELLATSEVERKMILMGYPLSYVIYDQIQGHLMIFLMYCLASLFVQKWTLHSFGMNSSEYKHVRQIV